MQDDAASAGQANGGPSPGGEAGSPTVAVVVTTFNDAQFLPDALRSVLNQSRPPDEIVVVDDGSTVSPASIVARHPGVRLIRQENRGLAGARNTGLEGVSADFILFLDADDVLLPSAIATGLGCFADNPSVAFVYGGHVLVDQDLTPIEGPVVIPCGADAFASFLRRNLVGMHAAVLYRREVLARAGGFDTSFERCEDYELYLRLSRAHAVAWHGAVVALYRRHHGNCSHDVESMLRFALLALATHRPGAEDSTERLEAWLSGHSFFREYYLSTALKASPSSGTRGRSFVRFPKLCRLWFETRPHEIPAGADLRRLARLLWTFRLRRMLARRVPDRAKRLVRRLAGSSEGVRAAIRDLPLFPVDGDFGHGRGDPVDRYYIEGFLEENRDDVCGRVLEVGDARYSRRFGGDRVTAQDILHATPTNPLATIVGEVGKGDLLPRSAFDCIIFTQTLYLIWDLQGAMRELYDALKPGGTLLVTVPGITPVDRGEWRDIWYWSLTGASMARLCETACGPAEVVIRTHGNVFAATAFLQGLAQQDIDTRKLDTIDAAFPVTVTARIRKPA